MKKSVLSISLGLAFAIILAACGTSNNQNRAPQASLAVQGPSSPTTSESPPSLQSTTASVPVTPSPQTGATGLPATGGRTSASVVTPPPPVSEPLSNGVRGAQVIPANNSASLNYLTTWMGMRVADSAGKVVGVASDYILNLCESHVLYLVLQPDPSLGIKSGSQVLIPLEIVTTAGGTLDAAQKVIFLPVKSNDIAKAPFVTAPVSLADLSWEQGVQAYWERFTRFSLSTQCGSYLPAGEGKPLTTPKIGLASNVLKATFQDEKKQGLGKVIEAVVAPESGFLRYLAIQLDPSVGNGIVLAPTGAMTIKDADANQEGSLITLIVGNASILQAAPRVFSLPNPADMTWEDQSYAYWSKYVKMTK